MLKIIKIIFFIMLINNISYSSCIITNPNYYYLNGVGVNALDARDSAEKLFDKFSESFTVLYNPTLYQGNIKIDKNSKFSDKMKDRILWGVSSYIDVISEVLPQKNDEMIEIQMQQSNKLDNIAQYVDKKSISSSLVHTFQSLLSNKNDIVFAHSQGNLYANELCYLQGSKKMQIISIATPAGVLPCNDLKAYSLFDNDRVIGAIRAMSVFNQFKAFVPTNNYDNTWSDLSHHELTTYLKSENTINMIKNALVLIKKDVFKTDDYSDFIKFEIASSFKPLAINNIHSDTSMEKRKDFISKTAKILLDKLLNTKAYTFHNKNNDKNYQDTLDNLYNRMILDFPLGSNNDLEIIDSLLLTNSPILNVCGNHLKFHNELKPICDIIPRHVGVSIKKDQAKLNDVYMNLSFLKNLHKNEYGLRCFEAPVGHHELYINYGAIANNNETTFKINGDTQQITLPKKNEFENKVLAGYIDIGKNDNNELSFKYAPANNPEIINNSIAMKMSSCNTYRKLLTNECVPYLKYLDEKYFTHIQDYL